MSYADLIAAKQATAPPLGVEVTPDDLHPSLFAWQAEIVCWAAKAGRAAIWADTGLGKTRMQLEWARVSGDRVLVVAPLAVCQQTVREARVIGIDATYARGDDQAEREGIIVTNYEMVGRFDPSLLDAVVLDEASILKAHDGKTRRALTQTLAVVPRRLTCTATPAPNDPQELTTQAEFLGRMTRANMLAAYFVHDQDGWRPKGHARGPMFRWMSSWALAIRQPSDLNYSNDGYELPGLDVIPELVDADVQQDGQLFATDLGGVSGRAQVRRATLNPRCERVAELVAAEADEPWVLWCGLNAESDMLTKLIPGAVNVQGNMTPEQKAEHLLAFADGEIRVLVTKPSLAAFGLNWQHCARMAFVGLSDSYEAYYQAIRRCYRFGQRRVVRAHVVLSHLEEQVAQNIARKEREARAARRRASSSVTSRRKAGTPAGSRSSTACSTARSRAGRSAPRPTCAARSSTPRRAARWRREHGNAGA